MNRWLHKLNNIRNFLDIHYLTQLLIKSRSQVTNLFGMFLSVQSFFDETANEWGVVDKNCVSTSHSSGLEGADPVGPREVIAVLFLLTNRPTFGRLTSNVLETVPFEFAKLSNVFIVEDNCPTIIRNPKFGENV